MHKANSGYLRLMLEMDEKMVVLTFWCGLLLGGIPLLMQVIWYWNDARFLASFWLKNISLNSTSKRKLPPGHMGIPFLGETIAFLWYFKFVGRPDEFINNKIKRYGKGVGLYRSHLFGSPSIISCSASSNKFVLQSSEDFGMAWTTPELIGYSSLVNIEGKQHTIMRSFILNAINHPNALRRIAHSVQPRVISTLRTWADKGNVHVYKEIKQMVFENICMMFLSMEPGPFLDEIKNLFAGVLAGIRAYPLDFPGTATHHARRCRRRLQALFKVELERRKRRNSTNGSSSNDDLMDKLMQVKDEEGRQISDDEVVDNIVSFVIAGYESTSLASMWGLYHIAKSPQVLEKLKAENESIREGNKDFITLEEVSRMKYTAKVVEETIRMSNIAPTITRVAKRDVDYQGFTIPKGYRVLVWLRAVHVDEKNFENPHSFIPERWDRTAKFGVFQAFGAGPRICAGNMLARLQLTILLHHLVLGHRWELVNPNAKINYLPHPVPIDGAIMTFSAR